jgi:subtilisin family serine protease
MAQDLEKEKTIKEVVSATAPESEMPTGEMAEPSAEGGMPSGTMDEVTSDEPMPSSDTHGQPTQGDMPAGAMEESEDGMPRFRPPDLPPGSVPPPSWEPGVVEVEFKEGVRPEITAESEGAPSAIRSSARADLSTLNQILQRHQLVKAEPSLQTSPEQAAEAQAVARQKGADVPYLGSFVTLHFPAEADTPGIAAELRRLPEVERAVPVPKAIPPQTPLNEPLVGTGDQVVVDPGTGRENQWYIYRCRSNQAWSMSSGSGVAIADIDWGYRTTHQDLSPRFDLTHAYNAVDGGTNVSHGGSIGHGTAVMGIAGGADNDLGIAGFAYAADLWPIQANSGPGTSLGGNSWARAIDWVRTADSGGKRKVIILEVQTGSYGNYEMVPSVNAAIRTAIAWGVVVCVAAGNGDRDAGIDDQGDPIPATGSILVGATAYHAAQNRRADFSNFSPRVTVCAPGDSNHDVTCSSNADNAYRNGFGGTSGATPKVAGTVALMLSVNPDLTHEEIRSILTETGTGVVTDATKPVGAFLNSEAAVRQARRSAAGRLEVFARGTDHALWHIWQTAPNNGWSGWASLGGRIDQPAIARNADGRLEAFAMGTDHALWHKWQVSPGGGWSGWASLGGTIDMLAVERNADGRLEVFARGMNGALYHIWQTPPNGGWSGWASLGGTIDMLAVKRNADGRLEVFARGMNRAVYHIWQTAPNGGWSGWASLAGWIEQLAVGRNADGRLEVFAIGVDRALWHKWQVSPGGGWSGWASLGGRIDMLAVGRNADGRLEVFSRGMNGALYHIWQTAPNNGWSGWASFGGLIDQLVVGQNIRG